MTEAVALARSIELAMEFFLPHAEQKSEHYSWSAMTKLDNTPSEIKFYVRRTDTGWKAYIDELEAALSLWLYSATKARSPAAFSAFPPNHDDRVRGMIPPHDQCFQILGPSSDVLVRDLDWWVPSGLDRILEGNLSTSDATHEVSANRVGCSGLRWRRASDERVYKDKSVENEKALEGVLEGLKKHDFQNITKWKCTEARSTLATRTASHSDFMTRWTSPPGEVSSILLVESRDAIEKLHAKELFSSFIWSMARCPDTARLSTRLRATIFERPGARDEKLGDDDEYDSDTEKKNKEPENVDAWKKFSLQNTSLSQLAQSVASTGLVGSENDAFLIFVPPLSANDRLPETDSLLQLAQRKGNEWELSHMAFRKATREERTRRWQLAGDSYYWGLTVGATLPRQHFSYLQSVAILMRYKDRLRVVCQEAHITGWDRLSQRNLRAIHDEIERRLNQVPEDDRKALQNFQQIHPHLILQRNFDYQGQMDPEYQETMRTGVAGTQGGVSRSQAGDVFGRTPGHHALEGYVSFFEPSLRTRDIYDLQHSLDEASNRVFIMMKRMILKDTGNFALSVSDLGMTEYHLRSIAKPDSALGRLSSSKHAGNPKAADLDGYTALHYVCMFPTPATILGPFGANWTDRAIKHADLLIRSDVDVNARALDGSTPLHHAAKGNCEAGSVPAESFLVF